MKQIISYFFIWRVLLFVIAAISVLVIPHFGGQFPYYQQQLMATGLPSWIWGFGNFDGVHYLRIAQDGYSAEYSQAFFPLYPLLISFFGGNFYAGIIISNLALIFSLFILYKLFLIDYDRKIVIRTLILLLAFPTAFYLGAIYSESLLLLFASLSIYFSRKNQFIYAGIFGGLASATRLFGLFLFIVIFVEFLETHKHKTKLLFQDLFILSFSIVFCLTGTALYIFFLHLHFYNPLYFINAQPHFGAGRSSSSIILLPQVYFRYFKIFITTPIINLKYFTAVCELFFTTGACILLLYSFRKIRLSYFLYAVVCLVVPTLTGTLSSMARYSLNGFLLLPLLALLPDKKYRLVLTIFLILQIILVGLFVRGYWVA